MSLAGFLKSQTPKVVALELALASLGGCYFTRDGVTPETISYREGRATAEAVFDKAAASLKPIAVSRDYGSGQQKYKVVSRKNDELGVTAVAAFKDHWGLSQHSDTIESLAVRFKEPGNYHVLFTKNGTTVRDTTAQIREPGGMVKFDNLREFECDRCSHLELRVTKFVEGEGFRSESFAVAP